MKRAAFVCHVVAVACVVCSTLAAAASSIVYQSNDLADTTPGQDLWQYSYLVSGSFSQFDEISIPFDAERVISFAPLSTPNANWVVVTSAQPQPGIPADGIYSTKALADSDLVSAPFIVNFVRKGTATPGPQSFEVLDGNFQLIGGGMTSPVPEPRGYLLLAAGLFVLGSRFLIRQRR